MAGGVGGAKFLLGLCHVRPPEDLAVIGNTGDDLEWLGLRICPDLDTIAYTLAGVVNRQTGWGLAGDTFHCLSGLSAYGVETWFRLGDQDLATHLHRTRLLREGVSLAEVTARICRALGVQSRILPMSEGYHPTFLLTDQGWLHLQEYLVREKCRPVVKELKYAEMDDARIPGGVEEVIGKAEAVILSPSNPLISIGPILAVPGLVPLLKHTPVPVIAITPIIEGQALKGPAAKMLRELGYDVSALAVARIYREIIDCFVLDQRDAPSRHAIERLGIRVEIMDTMMATLADKIRLASQVVKLW